MADPDHVALVRSRSSEPLSKVLLGYGALDLSTADLTGLDFSGADLGSADFSEAKLDDASFAGANLMYADFSHASMARSDLTDADMESARLFDTRFEKAFLVRTDLSSAELHFTRLPASYLTEATLTGAHLWEVAVDKTDFSRAHFGLTLIAGCNLSGARGLQSVVHEYPSTVGVDALLETLRGEGGTFTREQLSFFTEAGVPDSLLSALPGLLEANPRQFFSCFISFGATDKSFADKLYGDLRTRRVRCWKYDADAVIGRGIWANIDQAIIVHQKVIVICSRSSLQRPAVLREIERALLKEDELKAAGAPDVDVLVPIRLDDYVLDEWQHPRKADVTAKHIGDFRSWRSDTAAYTAEFNRLLLALDPNSVLGFPAASS